MKIQQQFRSHCCAMDFDFVFVMNECNEDKNKIAACVDKLYTCGCYSYIEHFTSAKIM